MPRSSTCRATSGRAAGDAAAHAGLGRERPAWSSSPRSWASPAASAPGSSRRPTRRTSRPPRGRSRAAPRLARSGRQRLQSRPGSTADRGRGLDRRHRDERARGRRRRLARPAHRPSRDPPRDRHRARRQQPGRSTTSARRPIGRRRCRPGDAKGRRPARSSARPRASASTATTPPARSSRELTARRRRHRVDGARRQQKAAWYQFQIALDIPEAADCQHADDAAQRRRHRARSRRTGRSTRARARSPGRDTSGAALSASTPGSFLGTADVYLGELRTDEDGTAALPRAAAATRPRRPQNVRSTRHSSNNATAGTTTSSDGPVTAEVTIDGRADPGRPGVGGRRRRRTTRRTLAGVRTLYDLLFDHVRAGAAGLPFPDARLVHARRLSDPRAPTRAAMGQPGLRDGRSASAGRDHFLDPEYLARLASDLARARASCATRSYAAFRDWDRDGQSPVPGRGSTATR